jgi:hypothetical protein
VSHPQRTHKINPQGPALYPTLNIPTFNPQAPCPVCLPHTTHEFKPQARALCPTLKTPPGPTCTRSISCIVLLMESCKHPVYRPASYLKTMP